MSAVPPDYLKDRIAVVTGGCGGIGRAVCQRFHAEGAVVYATDVASFDFSESNIHVLHHDVGSEEDAKAVMAHVEAKHDRLDILVNAAGIEIEKTIEDTTLEEWNRSFSVNVSGTFLTSKHALPLMRKAGSGSIINFGSYDGFIADPSLAVYCATKGAVHALTRAMACDHGPEGIRVNAVCPGYVDTPMLQSFFGESGDIESLKQAVRDVHPIRRYGQPEDIANAVLFFCSPMARMITGQAIAVDGGISEAINY